MTQRFDVGDSRSLNFPRNISLSSNGATKSIYFASYKFIPEHIKYFPCPPSPFSTYNSDPNTSSTCSDLQPFPMYKLVPEHIEYFPCPLSPFSMYNSDLSSKSFFLHTNSYRTRSSNCPVIQIIFPTYKFLPEQIKYFSLSSKYFSYVQILPEHVKYFSLSSKHFLFVQFLPERIKYFSLSSKYFLLSSKTIWRQ